MANEQKERELTEEVWCGVTLSPPPLRGIKRDFAIRDKMDWGYIPTDEFNKRLRRSHELINEIKARGLLSFKTANLSV
jgi:hypothetical protein